MEQREFKDIGQDGSFLGHVGGFKRRTIANGVETSLQVMSQHLNPNGTVHGGVLMTQLDVTLGMAVEQHLVLRSDNHPITIQLSCSMMAAAAEGAIIVGEAKVDASSRTMTWVSGRLVSDGRTLITGTAVFRNPPSRDGITPPAS